MSSGPGRKFESGERKNPNPAGGVSSTPSPIISPRPPFMCALPTARTRSCRRTPAPPSGCSSAASSRSSSLDFRLSSARCVAGGAAQVRALGAAEVVGVDTGAGLVEQARARHGAAQLAFHAASSLLDVVAGAPFDVVIVPESEAVLRRPEAIPSLARLLAPG